MIMLWQTCCRRKPWLSFIKLANETQVGDMGTTGYLELIGFGGGAAVLRGGGRDALNACPAGSSRLRLPPSSSTNLAKSTALILPDALASIKRKRSKSSVSVNTGTADSRFDTFAPNPDCPAAPRCSSSWYFIPIKNSSRSSVPSWFESTYNHEWACIIMLAGTTKSRMHINSMSQDSTSTKTDRQSAGYIASFSRCLSSSLLRKSSIF